MGIWYCTREDVADASAIGESAYMAQAIDTSIESASRAVEGLLHRKFYPFTGTRFFDWPDWVSHSTYRLWLEEDELVSVASLTSDAFVIPANEYFLEPSNAGPPYDRIELDRSQTSWRGGPTEQRNIAVTGVFCGCEIIDNAVGTVTEALDAVETQIDYSGDPLIGVGSILRVDVERMVVTAKNWVSTGQTATLAERNSDSNIPVANGAAFFPGENILVDSERITVLDIAGNNLIVKRDADGSGLATHTGATIYAKRSLTVQRGALGTLNTTHTLGAGLYLFSIPGLVRELCMAYAQNNLAQRSSKYARVIGTGEGQRESSGRGIREIEKDAYAKYGRQVRIRSV